MKKSMVIMDGAALGMALLVGTGCASKPQQAAGFTSATVPSSANVNTEPARVVVRDWSNRTMGMPTTPLWLQALILGNSGPVKQDFGISSVLIAGDNACLK
ncbi:hypothetical protein FACS1894124_2390 [Spirochaetia bacterium]|nr:hypothetical protein FACS1894124_2390 [Spirochaetia bacterium]